MESSFFPGSIRRVTLGPPAMLIGANKSRAIKVLVKMPLSGQNMQGMPEWLGEAYTSVSKHCLKLSPEVQALSDVSVAFVSEEKANGELFDKPTVQVPSSQIKKIEVVRAGDADEPDIELHFALYASFSRDLWRWTGEMAGNEVKMAFASSTPAGSITVMSPTQTSLMDAVDDEEEDLEPEAWERATLQSDVPDDPKMEEDFGPEYEKQVRASLGAPEPFSGKPRLVDARPRQKRNVN